MNANSVQEPDGELALDHREALLKGGSNGKIVVPGQPSESRLLAILRHEVEGMEMPQGGAKFSPEVIADFETWIATGAYDPRDKAPTAGELAHSTSFDVALKLRQQWWSLQPVKKPALPAVKNAAWSEHPIDRFILAALEAKNLAPAPEAGKQILLRRVTFALTGLPPTREEVDAFQRDTSPDAYEKVVDRLLVSPHFGERWARHWMDVVHYSDSHGFERDIPVKNGWMYRDYLVRAMNADLPFDQLIREQIAGDLLPARVDAATNINEAMIGPMAMRLGERRNGDNAQFEGTTQETVANIIDTVSKGLLGTTVACSQCHDHKFDAVPQSDYYALAGVFMSTRWGARCVDAVDPNLATIEELRGIKSAIRAELTTDWLASREALITNLMSLKSPADAKPTAMANAKEVDSQEIAATQVATVSKRSTKQQKFPATLSEIWHRQTTAPLSLDEFQAEHKGRAAANKANLTLMADFTPSGQAEHDSNDPVPGWKWDGFGMQHGLVADGELVIALNGNRVIDQILPAGRWSHVWSQRLGGVLRSSFFDSQAPVTFSVGHAGGNHAAQSFIIDQAVHPERMLFINQPTLAWLEMKAGRFVRFTGDFDTAVRRIYFEMATKTLNNNFPPRVNLKGMSVEAITDPNSWFGVTKIYRHATKKGPRDELARFQPLFSDATIPQPKAAWADRFADTVLAAVERLREGKSTSEDVLLLNDALSAGLLKNDFPQDSELAQLLARYRQTEAKLQPNRTIGSAAEWNEAQNERINIRGSYEELGDEVPRGVLNLLGGQAALSAAVPLAENDRTSGRLKLANVIASSQNPLTARVLVNRIWLQLFGEGLVRTPDDFGHLGERPTHPELLDWLTHSFTQENWSQKKLIRSIVISHTWRQSGQTSAVALEVDPENRLWHHRPLRRLDAEAIRDSLLLVSGRLDPAIGGPPIDPHRMAEDARKRLFIGPLDGNGRRSIYLKMTMMEPPKFLAIFNQPLPKLTIGKRDTTNVPDQALAMLNDPLVVAMAKYWSEQVLRNKDTTAAEKVEQMLYAAYARPPQPAEVQRVVDLVIRCAVLRGAKLDDAAQFQPAWQDAAHAIFNTKEFIYVY